MAVGCLAGLPSDVIALILSANEGRSLSRLLQCGCPVLNAKIVRFDGNLELILPAPSRFPFSAFHLPFLRHLSVRRLSKVPFRLFDALPLPPTRHVGLTTLIFEMPQCFRVLACQNGVKLLETLFPNLRHLTLRNSTKLMQVEQFLAIPQGLESLELKIETSLAQRSRNSLSVEYLSLLPITLTSACLSIGIWTQSSTTEDIILPPALKSLTISLQSTRIYDLFQVPLETLLLRFHAPPNTSAIRIPSSKLPKTLTRLHIVEMEADTLIINADGDFPPRLITFMTRLEWKTKKELTGLPKSIILCNRGFLLSLGHKWAHFLPNIASYHRYSSDTSFSPLPQGTKRVYLKNDISSLGALPSGLTSAGLEFPDEKSFSLLPPSVLELFILNDAAKIENFVLPSQLTRLSCFLSHFKTCDAISLLPCTITKLILSIPTEGPLNSELELPKYLPRNLTDLTIELGEVETCWREWISNLDHLEGMRAITIENGGIASEYDLTGRLDFFKHLPHHLTSLEVVIGTHLTADETYLHFLPKTLQVLSLSPACYFEPMASNECLRFLPSSLVTLLVSDLDGLTEEIFDILPPTLTSAQIRPKLPPSYYQQPIWEDHAIQMHTHQPESWPELKTPFPIS